MHHQTELKVGGLIYGGWKSILIQRGIEQISGTFELQVTDRWADQNSPRIIHQGDSCQVLVDGVPVITGYVDSVTPTYDKSNHGITIKGRDKTGDLVDCAAIYQSGQWSGRRIDQIAANLCEPFGIKVFVNTDVGTVFTQAFCIEESETVFECLSRAAMMKAVLLVSDGLGNLILTRASTSAPVAQLVQGENILSARAELSWIGRFSRYIVKGQAVGSDDQPVEFFSHCQAESTDAAINRYRPLIVLAEYGDISGRLSQRAQWERNVRMGRGCRATISVQGWAHGDRLWEPNTIVHVRSPYLGLDDDLLIVSVTYSLDEEGTKAELSLVRKEAFDLLDTVKMNRLNSEANAKNANRKIRGRDNSHSWL